MSIQWDLPEKGIKVKDVYEGHWTVTSFKVRLVSDWKLRGVLIKVHLIIYLLG